MQRLFKNFYVGSEAKTQQPNGEIKSQPSIVHFTDVKSDQKFRYPEYKQSALDISHKPIEFPAINMDKISKFTSKVFPLGYHDWVPVLPTLWGWNFRAERSYIWQFYDVALDKEAYINVETTRVQYGWGYGLGGFDEDTVMIGHSNVLDFWKYKDQSLQQISTITIVQFNRVISFKPDFQIKRLTPDHIVMVTSLDTGDGTCKNAALFVINTATYQEYKKFTLNYYDAKFCILPIQSHPLKKHSQFILISDSRVRLLEVNTRKKIKIKNNSIEFEKKLTPNFWEESVYISPSHIVSIRSDYTKNKMSANIFEIITKANKFAAQLIRQIPGDASCPINTLVSDPTYYYEVYNQWIYFKGGSPYKLCNLLDPSFVYNAEEIGSIFSTFHPISEREICFLSSSYLLHHFESPEYQIRKIKVFIDTLQNRPSDKQILPDSLIRIAAQYAFGLFAQNPNIMQRETKEVCFSSFQKTHKR